MLTRSTAAVLLLAASAALGQSTRPATAPLATTKPASRPATARAALSPAEALIEASTKAAAARPDTVGPYNVLAFAYARRARETGDPAWYRKVDEALKQSDRVAPGNADGQKVRALVLIAQGRPEEAKKLLAPLLKAKKDDLMARGLVSDADLALGDYDAAEKEAQDLLDDRPNSPIGLICAANLRAQYGDPDGAIELLNSALIVTPPNDSEERSRLLAMVARQHLLAERPVAAADAAEQAVAQFPGYADAMDALADTRAAEGKPAEALALRRQVLKLLPLAKYRYALARSLERSGKADEAGAAYKAFEAQAAAEVGKPQNADRLLVLYYADRANRPADALAVAEQLAKRTQDVYALDALAWAQHAAGQAGAAEATIKKALGVGIRNPTIFYHAAAIAADAGDRDAAADMLRESEELTPRPLIEDRQRAMEKRIEQMPATRPSTRP